MTYIVCVDPSSDSGLGKSVFEAMASVGDVKQLFANVFVVHMLVSIPPANDVNSFSQYIANETGVRRFVAFEVTNRRPNGRMSQLEWDWLNMHIQG